jgi:homoserine dehydrogenase
MLTDNREAIIRKVGAPFEVARIGVKDAEKPRTVPKELLTTDLDRIVDDATIDVIVEVIGGIEPAGGLIERALRSGKHVVTANKEWMAKYGQSHVRYAAANGLDLHYEAAVGGGIPLIQPLKHQLAGNDVIRIMGILNGTTNYILTKMADEGAEFVDVLAQAQAAGYAEADPTADVDGFDAQYKLAILASIAFGREVDPGGVYREGIRSIGKRDIAFADLLGYRLKLLGIVEASGPDSVRARVHPTMIPKAHPLASVSGVYNAVWFQGDFVGDVMFSGRGAGSDPTASAVVGDLVDIGRNLMSQGRGSAIPVGGPIQTDSIDSLRSSYYLRMQVKDRPKVLGQIASTFGAFDVSLAAMEMRVLDEEHGEIVFMTHKCEEQMLRAALKVIDDGDIVDSIQSCIRVVG